MQVTPPAPHEPHPHRDHSYLISISNYSVQLLQRRLQFTFNLLCCHCLAYSGNLKYNVSGILF